jgi:hypothetical protein
MTDATRQPEVAVLRSLVQRCEQASGPDRELDGDIFEATGGCAHRQTKRYVCQDDSGYTCLRCGKDTYGERVPEFTGSLDAAKTLVPKRVKEWHAGKGLKTPGQAYLLTGLLPNGHEYVTAATPALALTAASLRALIEQDK